jgi:hypothetical protein
VTSSVMPDALTIYVQHIIHTILNRGDKRVEKSGPHPPISN